MKKKHALVISFCAGLLAGVSAFADVAPEAACLSGSGLTEVIPLPNGMTFGAYTRMHPRGDFIIGTGTCPAGGRPGSSTGSSFIVDLRERGSDGLRQPRCQDAPLNVEAYATEGSWRFVADSRRTGGGGPDVTHMKIFDFNQLVARGAQAEAIVAENRDTGRREQFTDQNVNNWYQTAADLPTTSPNTHRFRLVQYGSLNYSDFEATLGSDGQVTAYRRLGQGALCRNLGIDASYTPILSKDGNEIALTANIQGRSGTFILKIGEGGNCTVADFVGPVHVKGSFSYPTEGTRGRFAYIGNGTDREGRSRQGLVVYNRDTQQTEWVDTGVRGANYSFPGFLRDGRIMVGQATRGNNSLVVTQRQFPSSVQCADCAARAAAAKAGNGEQLSAMWRQVCSLEGVGVTEAAVTPSGRLALDPKSCRAMVQKYYEDHVRARVIQGVSKNDLLAVCGG